jgi:hypothetical protein
MLQLVHGLWLMILMTWQRAGSGIIPEWLVHLPAASCPCHACLPLRSSPSLWCGACAVTAQGFATFCTDAIAALEAVGLAPGSGEWHAGEAVRTVSSTTAKLLHPL